MSTEKPPALSGGRGLRHPSDEEFAMVESVFRRIEERGAAPSCDPCKGRGCPACHDFGVVLPPDVLARHLAARESP